MFDAVLSFAHANSYFTNESTPPSPHLSQWISRKKKEIEEDPLVEPRQIVKI